MFVIVVYFSRERNVIIGSKVASLGERQQKIALRFVCYKLRKLLIQIQSQIFHLNLILSDSAK
jgi:hypothetical protein